MEDFSGKTPNGIELEQQDVRLRTRARIDSILGVDLIPAATSSVPDVLLLRQAAGKLNVAGPAARQPNA